MRNRRLTDTQVAVVATLVLALGLALAGAAADAIAYVREAAAPTTAQPSATPTERSSPCD